MQRGRCFHLGRIRFRWGLRREAGQRICIYGVFPLLRFFADAADRAGRARAYTVAR